MEDTKYRKISDILFSVDCDLDKLQNLLEITDESTSREWEDVFQYVKANEEINITTSICFDYVHKIREQLQSISDSLDKPE